MILAAMLSLAVYAIVDIEFPRLGLVRVEAADEVIIELGKSLR